MEAYVATAVAKKRAHIKFIHSFSAAAVNIVLMSKETHLPLPMFPV